MSMQAYRAYYQDGHFVPHEPVTIPDGCEAIVTILSFPSKETTQNDGMSEKSRRQLEAMRRFCEENKNCDEPIPEFERVKFREIDV